MDTSGLSLFRLIGQRLNWVGQRQDVTAQNIANTSTPHYQAQDLIPFETHLQRAPGSRSITPVATNAAHIGQPGNTEHASSGENGAVRQERVRDPSEVKPNGNSVSLDEELMHVAENATNHELALNLYRKQIGMIQTAVGARGGGG